MDFVDLWYYLKILGDSLSPMLFLVTMEVYSRMVKRMEGARLLRGFRADGRRGRGECVHICCLRMILFCFVMQKWSKSYMFDCCYFVFRL